MASSMMSSVVAPRVNTPTQATTVVPFIGLKSAASFPATKRANLDITSIASNGGRVQCMKVWPPTGNKKFETLSYLPDLSIESLAKEVQYLLDNKWVPCLEFTTDKNPFVYRENNNSPGYYDGRYWTLWKLPMFGCTDPSQVLNELEEAKKTYPEAHVRLLGFDNMRQVQCISIVVYKPKSDSA